MSSQNKSFAVHFDQKYVGSFDSYADAKAVIDDHANFKQIATIPSGADTVEIFACLAPGGIVNYAYASITY